MRRLIKKSPKLLSASGFTLIELLLVIVIIGILSGIVISVINPAQTRIRANETILRGNTSKVCYAMFACAANREDPSATCTSFVLAEITPPTGNPTNSTYAMSHVGDVITIVGTWPDTACTYTCWYDYSDGSSQEAQPGASCSAL